MSDALFPLRTVWLRGILHTLDETGGYCADCGELAEYLLEQGGQGSF